MPTELSESLGTTNQQNLIFVDSSIENYQHLLNSAAEGITAVPFNPQLGIDQISVTIATYAPGTIDSLHLVSHGASGELLFGNYTINTDSIESYRNELTGWAAYLSDDADILLYGCNVGAGDSGYQFIDSLSTLTGADVAASTDITGAQTVGGNWQLERTVGQIEATLPFDEQALTTFSTALSSPHGETLFLSVSREQTIDSIDIKKEDIVRFDGTSFSEFFDGSDVGAAEIAAFDIISDTEILMTFQSGVTLADLGSVSDRDIIKFTATSLGSTTTGTFERYFSGDAVGLNAGIDGLTQLSDNSLLISTDSKSNVVGIGSVRDEDILLFTPDSTGDSTP